jgi:hypothetical protein
MRKKMMAGVAVVGLLLGVAGAGHATPTYVLYGIEIDSDRLFTVDLTTGEVTVVGVLAASQIEGLAFDPDNGHFFGTDNSNHTLLDISIDPVAWSVAQLLPFGTYTNIAINPISGIYYSNTNLNADSLVTIDPLTGVVNSVGPGGGFAVESLAFDSSGRLFGIGDIPAPGQEALYEIDVSTGSILSVQEITSNLMNPRFDGSLAIHPVTGAFYTIAAIEGSLYQVDPLTGNATRIGYTGLRNIRSLDFAVLDVTPEPDQTPAPVPEPSTIFLMGAGVAALAGTRRKGKIWGRATLTCY